MHSVPLLSLALPADVPAEAVSLTHGNHFVQHMVNQLPGMEGVVAATSLMAAIRHLPETRQGDIQKRILEMHKSMQQAKSWEDLLLIEITQVSEPLREVKAALDRVYQTADLDDADKVSLRALTDKVSVFLHRVLNTSPKIRKLHLSRKFGAKYLAQAICLFKEKTFDGGARALLSKGIDKLSMPSLDIEQEFALILECAIEIAPEMSRLAQKIASDASRCTTRAAAAFDACAQRLERSGGADVQEVILYCAGSLAAVAAVALVLRGDPHHGLQLGLGAVVLLGGGLWCSSARAAAKLQLEEAREAAARVRDQATRKSERMQQLGRQLHESAGLLGPETFQMLHIVAYNTLLNIGVIIKDDIKETMGEEFLLMQALNDEGFDQTMLDFMMENDKLLKMFQEMETLALKVSEALVGEHDNRRLSKHFVMPLDANTLQDSPLEDAEGPSSIAASSGDPAGGTLTRVSGKQLLHSSSPGGWLLRGASCK